MDKNFWLGAVVGILVVIIGLLIFGGKINAPTNSSGKNATTTDDAGNNTGTTSEQNTIWNEFDGEIGI
jgi:hypothetical protein